MIKIDRKSFSYLFIIFIAVLIQSFFVKNYIIGVLFFICVALSLSITDSTEIYDKLYCTLLVSSIFEYTVYVPGHEKIYFFHIILLIVAIFTFFNCLKNGFKSVKIDKKILEFNIIWFVYICISFLWSKNKSLNIKYITIYLIMLVFLAMIVLYNNSKTRLKNTMSVLAMMFLVVVIIGLIEAITGIQLPVKHYYNYTVHKLSTVEIDLLRTRPIAFFYNPNNFGTFICLAIPFFFFLFTYMRNTSEKLIYFLLSLAALATVVLTTSRSNLMSIIAMLVVFTVIILKDKKLKGLIYPLIIVVGFMGTYKFSYILVAQNNASYIQKMNQKINKIENITKVQVGEESSEGERLTIVYDVINGVFHDKKLLGFGAGNTTQQLIDKNNTHGIYSPHSLAIEILGDFGIFFFILYGLYYLYLLFKLFVIANNSSSFGKVLAYSLITMLLGFVIASFAPSSVTYFLPYWIMFGITISCINLYGSR